MPRNSAGNYSLPNSPVVTGTTIESPDENTTRDDIAAEITNSLDRNGRGGMLAPFRVFDGSLAAPGVGFLSDVDNGMMRNSANNWSLVAGAQEVVRMTAAGVLIPSPITLTVGTLTATRVTFAGASGLLTDDAGMTYVAASDTLTVAGQISTPIVDSAAATDLLLKRNGTTRLTLGAAGVTVAGTLTATGGGSLTGTWSDHGTITTVDINGGTLDGVVIGGAAAAAASFTTGTFSSTLTLSGSAANIALGSNFISNGGTDAGISLDASNNATISGDLVISGGGISVGAVDINLLTVAEQVRIVHTASATRYITLTGSNGGNPTISTSAGDLAITPNIVVAGSATVIGNIVGVIKQGTLSTATGGTAIEFTSLPAGIRKITISWKGLSTNGTSVYIVQLGDSGGYENTGYISTAMSAGANTQATDGFRLYSTTALAADLYHGSLTLILQDAATFSWVVESGSNTASLSGTNSSTLMGSKSLTGTFDRIQITTQGGVNTFDANAGVNVAYEF